MEKYVSSRKKLLIFAIVSFILFVYGCLMIIALLTVSDNDYILGLRADLVYFGSGIVGIVVSVLALSFIFKRFKVLEDDYKVHILKEKIDLNINGIFNEGFYLPGLISERKPQALEPEELVKSELFPFALVYHTYDLIVGEKEGFQYRYSDVIISNRSPKNIGQREHQSKQSFFISPLQKIKSIKSDINHIKNTYDSIKHYEDDGEIEMSLYYQGGVKSENTSTVYKGQVCIVELKQNLNNSLVFTEGMLRPHPYIRRTQKENLDFMQGRTDYKVADKKILPYFKRKLDDDRIKGLKVYSENEDILSVIDDNVLNQIKELKDYVKGRLSISIRGSNLVVGEKTNRATFHPSFLKPFTSNIDDYFSGKITRIHDLAKAIDQSIERRK